VARQPAIAAAALFTWLANRRATFAIRQRASVGELARYAAVASSAAVLNYGLYAGLIALYAPPLLSIVLATAVVAVFSYLGYKRLAFRLPSQQ
jgi:putative flippase GtrA